MSQNHFFGGNEKKNFLDSFGSPKGCFFHYDGKAAKSNVGQSC